MSKKYFLFFLLSLCLSASMRANEPQKALSVTEFKNPPVSYRPYVWWHWMGPNFSKEGIHKDLEAMQQCGIGGATIFNLSSAVQESIAPTENNPWPWQTYRSKYYWEAIEYACKEAQRLGLELGLTNSVGYSTTGGPWIDEEKGMKHLVSRRVTVKGGQDVKMCIPQPELPAYGGWGAMGKTKPDHYDDIVTMAIPDKGNKNKAVDISRWLSSDNILHWKAPKGEWTILRIGYASTMSCPHPVPDDVAGKVLEVNKIDSFYVAYHWDEVLKPINEYLKPYIGKSFKHITIDSYEAGEQNWSRHFKDDFKRIKGYDPTPYLPALYLQKGDSMQIDSVVAARFRWDFNDVIAQLFQKNGWDVTHQKVAQYGLKLDHEPYWGQFSPLSGAASADLPMGEFWTSSNGKINPNVTGGARAAGKTVVGAESFTSRPEMSQWTEDPAMLKRSTEGAFASGVNRLVLHHWVHQPFDDRYQPGMGMGWWGTHFSRNQTWFEPGKAFFHYLGRCQYLLQQGEQVIDYLMLDKADSNSDGISLLDFLRYPQKVDKGRIVLPSGRSYALLEVPNARNIDPQVLEHIGELLRQGATIVSEKSEASTGLLNYPQCDEQVKAKAEALWAQYGGKQLFATRAEAIRHLGIKPDYLVEKGEADIVHRKTKTEDIYYIGNLTNSAERVQVSLLQQGRLPELWNAEKGTVENVGDWHFDNGRTVASLHLEPYQSRFIVFRRNATPEEIELGKQGEAPRQLLKTLTTENHWKMTFLPKLDTRFQKDTTALYDLSTSNDERIKYFAGTVNYENTFTLKKADLKKACDISMDLGIMNDIAIVKVNGEATDTLWYPPYRTDITRYVKAGKNTLEIDVTNTWANRMIGDEQYPADFEWGKDRGVSMGRAMKGYPQWFIENKPRPQKGRKCFSVWYYYRKDSKLQEAGLEGPVKIVLQR
ncbi:MAG: hypothetical protein LKG25_04480 [Prevotella sp.]|jgi:hypothetical protein|nr:hypothetical protein [Prevotella sp.]MCI1281831.1 hypothetical protein [Prevotella sp.]